MNIHVRHIVRQRKVIGSLMGTAARSLWQRWDRRRPDATTAAAAPPSLPGPELVMQVRAPSPALVRDYVRHVGGDPDLYLGRRPPEVPAHLFPQWTFPLATRALRGVPYRLSRALNGGCRLTVNAPLPASAPLTVWAQLMDVKDDDRRAVLHQRVTTGTASRPDAVVADLYVVVPKGSRAGTARPAARPDGPTVPVGARRLASFSLAPRAGLDFAMLTGDFNPVHWVRPYARAAGFASPILHGFAMMARTMEGLGRELFAGAVDRIAVLDVRFTRPLVLGAGIEVGLFLDGDGRSFFLADAPSTRPYLVGSLEAGDG